VRTVGVTAGASAPELLVQEVLAKLREFGACDIEDMAGVAEDVVFPIPKTLDNATA
jgi:4-hydroxy-3-methylbut-2-enyl diphosphate reductase